MVSCLFILSEISHVSYLTYYITRVDLFLKSRIWHHVCPPEKLRTNCGMEPLAALFIVANLRWFYWRLFCCIWAGFVIVSYLGSFLGDKYCRARIITWRAVLGFMITIKWDNSIRGCQLRHFPFSLKKTWVELLLQKKNN